MKKRNYKYLVFIFWFAVIAFLSYRMPLIADDYWHKTSFATDEDMISFSMVLPSVHSYYLTWGGRAVSMILIQSVLLVPRVVYAIFNALFFVGLGYVILGYARSVSQDNLSDTDGSIVTAIIYLFLWYFTPEFAGVMLWSTGSITYLWMNTVVLAFGLIYYRDYKQSYTDIRSKQAPGIICLKSMGMVFLGICAGISTETASCTLLLCLILYMVWAFRTHHRISIDKIFGMISCLFGCMVLMLAPGNRVRAYVSGVSSEQGDFITVLMFRIARETFYTLLYLLIPLSIVLALYILRVRLNSKDYIQGRFSLYSGLEAGEEPLFIICAMVSIYALTFSAGFADRIYEFPICLLAVSLSLSLVKLHNILQSDALIHNAIIRTVMWYVIILMLSAIIQIIAGSMYASQSGSYFDRQMFYYHMDDGLTTGLMPGNGLSGE